ncbi:hypothetical protein ACNOYE_19950 [Nannocystaceae bacterium ST9]
MQRLRGVRSLLALFALLPLACGDTTSGDDEVGETGSSTSDDEIGDTTSASTSGESTSQSETTTGDGDGESTTGDEPLTPLQAGAAVRYLEYPVGISMAGYGGRVGSNDTAWTGIFYGTKGFYGYPTIKAMAMRSEEGELVVLMKTPMMSSESGVTDATVAKMQELYGLDLAGRIIMGGTHSHHAHGRYWRLPDIFGAVGADTPDEEVIDLLATEFAMTIKAAIDDIGDAEWGYTYVENWDPDDKVHGDRRGANNPLYGKDPRLLLLALRRPDGTPMATLINFGMHGISVAFENELLTEDAPGGVEIEFEEYFFQKTGKPILGVFAQSGGGDSSPRGGFLSHQSDTQKIELLGTTAAKVIYDAYQTIEWNDDPEIVVRSQRVDLTYDKFGYDENGEFSGTLLDLIPIDYTWGGWQCTGVAEDDDLSTSMEGKPKQCIPVDTLLLGDVPHPEIHQTYLSTAKIGPLVLLTMPGEPAYSIVKYAREQLAMRSTPEQPLDLMVWGYAQDHLLYFTAPDDWYQGGYESEMSLWGPYAGKFMVDTNMTMIDAILAGQTTPAFVEENPNLQDGGSFDPRGWEISGNSGIVVEDVITDKVRTELVRFRFGGGDPTLGAPNVRVQYDDGNGEFVDVPSPAGWAGHAYDNSRNHMITHFEPDPPPNNAVAAQRDHEWWIDWEIPSDFPAGIYRLVATGPYWSGNVLSEYEAVSAVFEISQSDAAVLAANLVDPATLHLTLTLPPVPLVMEGTWPKTGWRLHDSAHGPQDPIHVSAPLSVQFTVDGVQQAEVYAVEYDEAAQAYVFDFGSTGIDPAASVEIEAWLAADHEPSVVSTML